MTRIHLPAQFERLAPENPYPTEFAEGYAPLDHQIATARAADAAMVINTHTTGTGKTRAAFLRFLEAALADRGEPRNCLLIAPTNELVRQHARDAAAFLQRHRQSLSHTVLRLDAAALHDLQLLGLERGGAKLHAVLQDPRILDDSAVRRPFILVVNPDIFYCALYFRYGRLDQRNLFMDFMTRFDTVIIDEFHYYNAKQFANFLFFFALSAEYGYFAAGATRRQIVLLTATPNATVRAYLDRLGVSIASISPDHTQTWQAGEAVPALAPVDLEVVAWSECPRGVVDLIEAHRDSVVRWIQQGHHGAVISDALWRINAVHAVLRAALPGRLGRLTGAEGAASRSAATGRDLLLATPTVDIGYNFERPDKPRQSLDFLFFEAGNGPAFVQRLGRAGRVLGKPVVDWPSTVLAVVPDALARSVATYDGQTLSRSELAQLAGELLPAQHNLAGYIARSAIDESFLPLLKLANMSGHQQLASIQDLYDRVYQLFAPRGGRSFASLMRRSRAYVQLEQLHHRGDERAFMDVFIDKQAHRYGQAPPGAAERPAFYQALAQPQHTLSQEYGKWRRKQAADYAVQQARFNFRDCLDWPEALIYDPTHVLAEADFTRYDALHIVQNYEATFFSRRAAWLTAAGIAEVDRPAAPFYAILHRQRDARPRLSFQLQAAGDRENWERAHCHRLTALYGLEPRLDALTVSTAVLDAVQGMPIVCLVLPIDGEGGSRERGAHLVGLARRLCSREGIAMRELRAVHDDGNGHYLLVAGTAALLLEAELRHHLGVAQAATTGGIIL